MVKVRTREEVLASEKEIWNERLLERSKIRKLRRHAFHYSYKKQDKIIKKMVHQFEGKDVLELGSYTWFPWMKDHVVKPNKLSCINISEEDLKSGEKLAEKVNFNTEFHLMDANDLTFDDESFDIVFGGAILHHLEIEQTINHVHRVLKPNGLIMFLEPLNINPLYKIYRKLNPKERTPDEHALVSKELKVIENKFSCNNYYSDFFSVFTGFIALKIYGDKNHANWLNKLGYNLDILFSKIPLFHVFFARVIIYGSKKQ